MVLTSKRLILYFNPRSHERSDCYSNISLTFSSYFNPRSHERSDATTLRQGIYRLNFNPRSHERSDWRTAEQAVAFFEISIHAPTRGATCAKTSCTTNKSYFNPRSHERSDLLYLVTLPLQRISIHAPTRGATEYFPAYENIYNISIHAPTRGATGR